MVRVPGIRTEVMLVGLRYRVFKGSLDKIFNPGIVTVQNVEVLHNAGCMQLLRPLLLDSVPNIQQTAALALSRLAGYSEELSEAIVHENILIQLVYSLRFELTTEPKLCVP